MNLVAGNSRPFFMSDFLSICKKQCPRWANPYSFDLVMTKIDGILYACVRFYNGDQCVYRTDLTSVWDLMMDELNMRKWIEMTDSCKMEILSPHIVDVETVGCGLYAEVMCSVLNE